MTIDDFMDNYNIKSRKKVIKWISEDLIPGAILSTGYIPNSARPPYTQARAKKADAIMYSIVKASRKRYHVLPKIYKICPDEFEGYIRQLVNAELIIVRTTDNINYYDVTLKVNKCKQKDIISIIEACLRGISQGVATAYLDNMAAV